MLASVDETPAVLADHYHIDTQYDERVVGEQPDDEANQRLSDPLVPRLIEQEFIVNAEVVAHAEKQTLIDCLYAPLGRRFVERHLHHVADVEHSGVLHRLDLES